MLQHRRWKLLLVGLPLLMFAVMWLVIGRRPQLLPGLGGRVTAIAFSPDGQTLVCASNNDYVQKWMPDIQKWRSFESARNYMSNLPPLFLRLRFSPDGQTLYAGGSHSDQYYSSVGHAWDVTTRRRRFAFNYLKSPAFDVSPNGRWAALGYRDRVHLVDLNGKAARSRTNSFSSSSYGRKDFRLLPTRYLPAMGEVTCVAFSPDSQTLAVGTQSLQRQLAFWDVLTARGIPTAILTRKAPTSLSLPTPSSSPSALSAPLPDMPTFIEWSPEGNRIAAASSSHFMIYNTKTAETIKVPWLRNTTSRPAFINRGAGGEPVLAWSPDGQRVFSGGDEVRQWRASDLRLQRSFGIGGPVAVAPDGRTLATANRSGNGDPAGVWLWKIS